MSLPAFGQPRVWVVFGPTGSGKTELAVRLARQLGTEVVNADPAQCYRGLPILTNQPGPEHDAIAPHRLNGVWGLDHDASAATFAHVARATIDQLIEDHGTAVLCGGSGLYLRAAISDLAFAAPPTDDIGGPGSRAAAEAWYDAIEPAEAELQLARVDPDSAARLHPNDRQRMVRAWEVAHSDRRDEADPEPEQPQQTGSIWTAAYRHPTRVLGLRIDRAIGRERIAVRTRRMFDRGVLDEVADVVGPHAERANRLSETAAKIHGLSDCLGALRGDWDATEACRLLTIRTQQYLRRQDIWARKWAELEPVKPPKTPSPEAWDRLATSL